MGKNSPSAIKSREEEQNEGKESVGKNQDHKHGKSSTSGIHVLFRGIFDKILNLKYSFYQNWSNPNEKIAGSTFLAQVEGSEEKDERLAKTHGPVFIICFCSGLILFYIVTSLAAHCVYREWKGLAEDCAGGSINGTDGKNFLHYAVIAKREEDAIEERAEIAKKKREYAAKRAKAPAAGDDMEPLME